MNDHKRLENLKARAAMAGLELRISISPGPGWSLSNWHSSRFFDNLNELENWLNVRIGGQL